jgi:hypothetical protein
MVVIRHMNRMLVLLEFFAERVRCGERRGPRRALGWPSRFNFNNEADPVGAGRLT